MRYLLLVALSGLCTLLTAQHTTKVNPFVGTDAHGHTHPAATLPFGMVQLGPDTRTSLLDWDACSGYHYSDSIIYGFSHTHLSGTGVPDYCDILVQPFTGKIELEPQRYAAVFDKEDEMAAPGYYKVRLKKDGILCEMTATERVGVHRYTFPEHREQMRLLVDLRHRDEVLESGIKVVSDREIEGYRISKGWAERQVIYFVMRFSQPLSIANILDMSTQPYSAGQEASSKAVAGVLRFHQEGVPLVVTVGISGTSVEGARRNLAAECPGFAFDEIRKKANEKWEQRLGMIDVEGGTAAQQRTFYTALYHSLLAPNLWSDADGQYRGRDGENHSSTHPVYTVFSLWDTYRAANPLHALIAPEEMRNFIKTFLLQYREGGILPVWELAANETNCMIGNHAIPVILEAAAHGLVDEADMPELLEAMVHSATLNRLGLPQYREKGYVPADQEPESVSKTLEYAFDDWCISAFARKIGKEEIATAYASSARNYLNVFDPATRFFRGRNNGGWHKPFDPREVNFNYTEANAWQYRFAVPQDINQLITLMGGYSGLESRLDSLFNEPAATTGRNQADITGLIGQYAQGNEPCHHVAYLYNYVGAPENTQLRVAQIRRELFSDRPDGLCGNDDCGQMSAWYVWSAMGLYPVQPGTGKYSITTPLFAKTTIKLAEGKQFQITSNSDFPYIETTVLGSEQKYNSELLLEDLQTKNSLSIVTASHPGKWAHTLSLNVEEDALHKLTPVPFVAKGERVFTGTQQIELGDLEKEAAIFYQLNDGAFQRYEGPVEIKQTCTLRFYAEQNGQKSAVETARFHQKTNNAKVLTYAWPYSPQYTGGGNDGLTDGLPGGADFRSGGWQGFEGKNLEIVLDLGKKQAIRQLSGNFLQDENSWIFFPEKLIFEVSDNGKKFTRAAEISNDVPATEKGTLQKLFKTQVNTKARYIRVTAVNRGQCPPGHKGAGYDAWLFCDEITVE